MTTMLGRRSIFWFAACLGLAATALSAASRADVLERGQLAVTRFSGLGNSQDGVAATSIDTNAASFVILDAGKASGEADNAPLASRIRFKIPSGDIGQVFGVALDDGRALDGQIGSPNIYLTATSAFGLRIVDGADQPGVPLARGRPSAIWMKGQFGTEKGGGPGAVWKVDGRTGTVSLLTTIRAFGMETGAASLGAIAFDSASRMLYVSSLQTGFIHRLDLNGVDFGYFDHGVEGRVLLEKPAIPADPAARRDPTHPQFEPQNPASWGFAPRERLVYGLAVHESRLYYAVADGPQIWSVGLNPDGSFAGDAHTEITQTGTAAEFVIAQIAFDASGTLYLAERVFPGLEAAASADGRNPSAIRRFALTPTADSSGRYWAPLADRLPGGGDARRVATSGGLAIGYGQDNGGALTGTCEGALWLTMGPAQFRTGAANHPEPGNPADLPSLQRFALPTPEAATAIITEGDDVVDRLGVPALGAVETYAPCPQAVAGAATPPTGQPSAQPSNTGPLLFVDQSCKPCPVGGSCTCRVTLTNRGREAVEGQVGFRSAATILSGPQAGELRGVRQSFPDVPQWACNWLNSSEYECLIDGASLRPGARHSVDLLIDTRDLVESGNLGLQNCATLLTENGASEGQRVCVETGLDIAVTESGRRTCVAGVPCISQVTITNLTSTPFDGDLKLTHFVFVPGKGNLVGSMTVTPPLECQPNQPPASPLECVARLSLGPGESRVYEIAMTLLGDGATSSLRGVLCATATDSILDISKVLPGLPPVPLVGPGYHCRPFRLLPEGSPAPGEVVSGESRQGGGGQSAGGGPQSGGEQGSGQVPGQKGPEAGRGTGQGQPGQSAGAGQAPGSGGITCAAGTIADGTQCVCPRGATWDEVGCVADAGGAGQAGAKCSDGSLWNGVSCAQGTESGGGQPGQPGGGAYPSQSGGEPSPAGQPHVGECRPPFQPSAKGCACPERSRWTGLRCAPEIDYENPQDYGSMGQPSASPTQPGGTANPDEAPPEYGAMAGPPCQEGQVRDSSGKCVCPPYLEQVVENGQQLCCLVPCPAGMKRENGQCVPDVKPVAQTPIPTPPVPVLTCPQGWAGVHPTCCPPPQTYANGRCEEPTTPAAQVPIPPPPIFKCPEGWRGIYPVCCEPGLLYANGRCEAPAPVRCENGMIGSPPNCHCPSGTELVNGSCTPMLCPVGTNGVYPVCCPAPARYVNGACERAAAPLPLVECRRDMVGTPPNCYCPQGTQDNGSRCVPIRRPECRSDMVGTPPNCECPQGMRDNGSRCVPIRRPECRSDMVGTPPNCECPQGMRDNGSRCVPIRRPQCRDDMVGTPPNCECPRGTQDNGSRCVPSQPQICPRGMVGTPPNCECPRGTQDNGSRCVPIRRPECRRDMVGTPPNCYCPQGMRDNGSRCPPLPLSPPSSPPQPLCRSVGQSAAAIWSARRRTAIARKACRITAAAVCLHSPRFARAGWWARRRTARARPAVITRASSAGASPASQHRSLPGEDHVRQVIAGLTGPINTELSARSFQSQDRPRLQHRPLLRRARSGKLAYNMESLRPACSLDLAFAMRCVPTVQPPA